ncbi:hypothetical protein C1637_14060 [Chryseobacterium lactis]|uniref:Uncharacterized protein n=1 Tax=Chryseobacterium lactis TaxID=1241981 RepID=A0A3G6RLR8_CHRLC|nr:hypothetical protein [Chryseobacterium lactis]AZA83754.1 hypothetical protein EG342_18505 [Chryseobacterium lactis]AZB04139.1 hypothetical protein EG341_09380 [Chryseobacterium lactis]PNW12952.1 hypothetical protein C1637_14060 [Chryseobacterium lactis]
MKNKSFLLFLVVPSLLFSQIGINTSNPKAILHIDGGKDNPLAGDILSPAQQANDFVVTSIGQVGIKTITPNSSLTINGSLQAAYKEITSSTTLTDTDFYIVYTGNTSAIVSLPAVAIGSSSFAGRIYKIKNISSSTLTIKANGTDKIRLNNTSSSNTVDIPTNSIVEIVNNTNTSGGNTWDLSLTTNNISTTDNYYKLLATDVANLNSTQNLNNMGINNYQFIPNSTLTLVVPSGYNTYQAVLRWDLWGDVSPQQTAGGSLRYGLKQINNNITTQTNSIMMSSWSFISGAGTTRFSAPVAIVVSGLTPGTYTFQLGINREDESTGSYSTSPRLFGLVGLAQLYGK